jgi:4-amino-4-deoxy-L-arabinose transferase
LEIRSRAASGVVITVVAALLMIGIARAPLTDPDEARLARTSAEMLSSGDLVVPTYGGDPHLSRPPLLHWFQAAIFRWLGAGEFSARLPSILATLGSLLLTAFVARRRFGDEGAAWAGLVFGTMPIVLLGGKVGNLEAIFAVHVLAALALDLAEPGEAGPYRAAAVGGLTGLAFLVKGPVGIVLPVVLLLAGRTAAGRNVLPGARQVVAAAGAFSVVVLPWALAFVERVGWDEALGILRREALEPYFGGGEHAEPSWYYAKIVAAGFFPWLAPLAIGLVRLLGRRRDPASRTGLYAAAALLAGLLFLSLGQGKLAGFVLPLAPLAALVITWELGQELSAPAERRLATQLLIVTCSATSLFLAWGASVFPESAQRQAALVGAGAHAAAVVAGLLGMALQRVRWVYGATAAASWILMAAASAWFYPAVAGERSAAALPAAVPELHSSRPVVVVGDEVPSLTFYLDRHADRIRVEDLEERATRGDGALIVVPESLREGLDLETFADLREVGAAGRFRAYEARRREAPTQ